MLAPENELHPFTAPVSCVVPAYNEGPRIAAVLAVLSADPRLSEIIVVDDGSSDETAQVAEQYAQRDARLHLLRLTPNQGKAAAMRAGAEASAGDALLFLDADLTGLDSAHVTALVEPVLAGRAAMTIGVLTREDGVTDAAHYLSAKLSGERCLRWSQFREAPLFIAARYGAETALNLHARATGLEVCPVRLEGVSHCRKLAKRGLLGGLALNARMYLEIGRYLLRATRLRPRSPRRADA